MGGRARVPAGREVLCQRLEARGRRGPHPGIGGEDTEVAHAGWPSVAGRHHEVRLSGGRGPLHPVGEPSVGQGGQSLERQGPAGAVVAEPLEADDVIFVEPGVGMEGEALQRAGGQRRGALGRGAHCLRRVEHSRARRRGRAGLEARTALTRSRARAGRWREREEAWREAGPGQSSSSRGLGGATPRWAGRAVQITEPR